MHRYSTIILVVLVACLLTSQTASALSSKVGASERLCMGEYAKKDQKLYFQFQVVAGGKLDIDVIVYDTAGRQIRDWRLATTGSLEVQGDADNDYYKFCFSNEMARFTPKWVDFTIRKGQIAGNMNIARAEHIDPIEQKIAALRLSIDSLHDAQQRLKIAEKDHRATIEDSNERILLWSVFEVIAFFAMGIFQIFFLKRFLERKTFA